MRLIPGPRDFAAYLYRIRAYIYIILGLWIFSTFIGIVMAIAMPQESGNFVGRISDQMKPLLSESTFTMMINIFLNNSRACAMEVVLGPGLGIVTLLIVFVNGLAMGLVLVMAMAKSGPLITLAALLPHGIIEVPVVIVSAAIGLRFGYCVLMALIRQPVDLVKEAIEGISVFVFWLIPLLFVAAFVESYVTMNIVLFLTGGHV
ncbi:MAG TPA: stage II sporulation protein M [Methanocella sp.]|nr:stage II sporulation protein M [Methanocella sp.]